MKRRPAVLPLLLTLALPAGLLAVACGEDSHQVSEHHEPLSFLHGGDDEETAAAAREASEGLVPPGLGDIESVPVRLGGHDFRVATRAGELVTRPVQAPCSECHGPQGATPAPPGPGDAEGMGRPAHWQISRAHGAAPLACASCHAPEDPASLRVPTMADPAEGWPLEHSYRLCGTCHFGQLRDWAGGAHGKRLAGWSGPRVVAPCTACHDPHDPGLPRRLPATFSPPPDGDGGGDRLDEDER